MRARAANRSKAPRECPWHVASGLQEPLPSCHQFRSDGDCRRIPCRIERRASPRKIWKHTALVITAQTWQCTIRDVQSKSHVALSSWARPRFHNVWKIFVPKCSFTNIMFLHILSEMVWRLSELFYLDMSNMWQWIQIMHFITSGLHVCLHIVFEMLFLLGRAVALLWWALLWSQPWSLWTSNTKKDEEKGRTNKMDRKDKESEQIRTQGNNRDKLKDTTERQRTKI